MPRFENIDAAFGGFIESQKVFFVVTAAATGRVNVAAKGMDTVRGHAARPMRMVFERIISGQWLWCRVMQSFTQVSRVWHLHIG